VKKKGGNGQKNQKPTKFQQNKVSNEGTKRKGKKKVERRSALVDKEKGGEKRLKCGGKVRSASKGGEGGKGGDRHGGQNAGQGVHGGEKRRPTKRKKKSALTPGGTRKEPEAKEKKEFGMGGVLGGARNSGVGTKPTDGGHETT